MRRGEVRKILKKLRGLGRTFIPQTTVRAQTRNGAPDEYWGGFHGIEGPRTV